METIKSKLEIFDEKVINFSRKWGMPFSRFAIFVVYFYFGALKVFELSPASPLVSALLAQTMSWISPEAFLIAFGLLEMLIGIVFLIPHLERLAVFALVIHLVTTVMPLFILPAMAWSSFLVPTLEGQYIIKNILLIALALGILSHLHTHKEVV
ncbi:MAG: hypothetical protein KBD52_02235 [Candidatus Pacebacteria bacterium]|nr:hypothetical protein [Candidatus Paceibacterota bacterium]